MHAHPVSGMFKGSSQTCKPPMQPFKQHAAYRRKQNLTGNQCQCRAAAEMRQMPQQPDRRTVLAATAAVLAALNTSAPASAIVEGYTPMNALKGKDYGKARMSYADYVRTPSGLQYSDLVEGKGEAARQGSICTVDWDGFTIGYYGRPFEARNKSKGGAFSGDDKEFLRVVVGQHQVIPAFEEALDGMKVGGVRRIIVPEELGYPNNDFSRVGPQPSTFSGKRALDFVLKNQGMIDKTLLFDIELMRLS